MSTRGAFVVPVRDLDSTGRAVTFAVPVAWLRGALQGCEVQPAGPDAELSVFLSKTGRDVLVRGTVDAELVVPCARCLDPVRLHPQIGLSLVLAPVPDQLRGPPAGGGGGKGPQHDRFSAEDVDVDSYEGDEVTLDRFVREAILLESPIFPLCSEACEGIRPGQRAGSPAPSEGSRVSDPRFSPLLEMVKKRPTKE
jgi:DUF177 domain-containing protein